MNKEELLKAFAGMSAEDQQAIRAQLKKSETQGKETPCCPGPIKEHMMEMMKAMIEKGQENPMKMCQQMMQMCQEKMGQMGRKAVVDV
jgi:hypothetical protein